MRTRRPYNKLIPWIHLGRVYGSSAVETRINITITSVETEANTLARFSKEKCKGLPSLSWLIAAFDVLDCHTHTAAVE